MDPLDEILEAAGIPSDAPQRIVAQRDSYNVVGGGNVPSADVRTEEDIRIMNGMGTFTLNGEPVEVKTWKLSAASLVAQDYYCEPCTTTVT